MAKLQCYLRVIILISCSDMFTRLEAHNPKQESSTKLLLINTVFRHGDRTLDRDFGESYPNDPNKNFDSYPDGDGQLINNGKRRAYSFGKILRGRYDKFLGEIYYQPNIYARSTGFPRTKMTLQLVLAGLYPPAHIQRWNPSLSWQPVDLRYTFILQDGLLFSTLCPKFQQKMSEIQQSPAMMAEIQKFDNLAEELTKYTGKNITGPSDFFFLYQTLKTQYYLGLRLPEWTQDLFPSGKLFDANLLQYKLYNYNDEITRLGGGQLLYRMIQDMKGVINGTLADRKINLFSAHDINVVNMLYALDVYDNSYPEYTSAVIVELHEKNDNYFVKILRYLGIPPVIVEVRIPGCTVLCPFDKFVSLRSAVIADEEDPQCPTDIPDLSSFYVGYLIVLMYSSSVTAKTTLENECPVERQEQDMKLLFVNMLIRQGGDGQKNRSVLSK